MGSGEPAEEEDERALEVALRAAVMAGEACMRHFERLDRRTVHSKSARRDLVSAADLASERVLLEEIGRAFPGDAIHAEESSRASGADPGGTWFLDPLDGTTNFVHGLPEFTVSVGRFVDGAPAVAVVHAPRLHETFAARRGAGATRNGRPIHVSATEDLPDALIATGFPYRRTEVANDNVANFANLVLRVRDLRRLGSAALDLAFVACGRFDGYWEMHLEPHDVVAGALLVREAGGRVTAIDGSDGWAGGKSILATNGSVLHDTLRDLLRGP